MTGARMLPLFKQIRYVNNKGGNMNEHDKLVAYILADLWTLADKDEREYRDSLPCINDDALSYCELKVDDQAYYNQTKAKAYME